VSGCYHAADPDGRSLRSDYRALERMFSYFAGFQPDEGRRKVVGPATEGAI